MSNYIPRWYQDEAHNAGLNFLSGTPKGRHPLICMPTGTGKSYNIARLAEYYIRKYPMMRVFMLTHVAELIRQNAGKLRDLWPSAPLGIFSDQLGMKNGSMPITYGGVASVVNALKSFPVPHLVLIDEAQLVGSDQSSMYLTILNYWLERNPLLRIIGYSATPYRVGMGMLTNGGIFTDIAYDITGRDAFNRLIDEAYLAPLIPGATETAFDVTRIKTGANDFNQRDAQAVMDVAALTRMAIEEALERAANRRKWLVFTQGIEHAEHVAEMLRMYGQSVAVIHSKNHPDDNRKALEAYRNGYYRILVNADMLTTGFDDPAIDCIIMLRATTSTGLWVQMLGRGTRPLYAPGFWLQDLDERTRAILASPKQNCLVLDFADNTSRLGPINDPYLPKKKGESRDGPPPLRKCEKGKVRVDDPQTQPCLTWNFAAARFCSCCGAEFMFDPKLTEKASTAALVVKDQPHLVRFNVDQVVYQRWTKRGSPDSIQIQYYCGKRRFSEWITFDNDKVSKLARDWWRKRFNLPPDHDCPPSVKDALDYIHLARTPVQIDVHENKQYPTIQRHIFKEDVQNGIPETV